MEVGACVADFSSESSRKASRVGTNWSAGPWEGSGSTGVAGASSEVSAATGTLSSAISAEGSSDNAKSMIGAATVERTTGALSRSV